ncbi:MAG: hypothetical protein MZU97_19930 [Bacillus subtilis]|nr:hypothetical protein [Bacillus subtilis]
MSISIRQSDHARGLARLRRRRRRLRRGSATDQNGRLVLHDLRVPSLRARADTGSTHQNHGSIRRRQDRGSSQWNNTVTYLAITQDFKTYKKLGRMTDSRVDDRDVFLFPEADRRASLSVCRGRCSGAAKGMPTPTPATLDRRFPTTCSNGPSPSC